jgi:hypothetical protein
MPSAVTAPSASAAWKYERVTAPAEQAADPDEDQHAADREARPGRSTLHEPTDHRRHAREDEGQIDDAIFVHAS